MYFNRVSIFSLSNSQFQFRVSKHKYRNRMLLFYPQTEESTIFCVCHFFLSPRSVNKESHRMKWTETKPMLMDNSSYWFHVYLKDIAIKCSHWCCLSPIHLFSSFALPCLLSLLTVALCLLQIAFAWNIIYFVSVCCWKSRILAFLKVHCQWCCLEFCKHDMLHQFRSRSINFHFVIPNISIYVCMRFLCMSQWRGQ